MTFPYYLNQFSSGQISVDSLTGRTVEGRSDLPLYNTALRTCSNWVPTTSGALFKRNGLKRIARLDDVVKIVPFIFDKATSQVYLFAFRSGGKLNVYRNDTLVAADIVIPWSAAQLPTLKWMQALDTFIGFHPDVAPTKIVRSGSDASWTVTTLTFTAIPTHDFGSGAEPVWSVTRGWPMCGTLHQNRVIYGGSKSLPQTVWGSVISDFYNLTTTPVADDMSFEFTMSSDSVHAVQDVFSINKRLVINTAAAEWTEESLPITPSNVSFQKRTEHGMLATGIRAVGVDTSNLFVDRQQRLRVFTYDFNNDVFSAQNLTTLAPGILTNPTAACYVRGLYDTNLAFFRNDDGTLSLLTIDFEQKVRGWSTMDLGDGTVTDLCGLDDVLYAAVSYNGMKFITKFTPEQDRYLDMWQSDTDVSPTTTWAGFTDFANQTITVLGDGLVFKDIAVDGSGNFTLPQAVSEVIVGIPFIAYAETLPIMPTLNGMPIWGQPVRKVKLYGQVRDTKDLWVDGRRVELRSLNEQLLDQGVEAIADIKPVTLSGRALEPTVIIESRDPLPSVVLKLKIMYRASPPRP